MPELVDLRLEFADLYPELVDLRLEFADLYPELVDLRLEFADSCPNLWTVRLEFADLCPNLWTYASNSQTHARTCGLTPRIRRLMPELVGDALEFADLYPELVDRCVAHEAVYVTINE